MQVDQWVLVQLCGLVCRVMLNMGKDEGMVMLDVQRTTGFLPEKSPLQPAPLYQDSTAVEEEEDDKKPITVNPEHKSLMQQPCLLSDNYTQISCQSLSVA